jgi:hypothetical protein
LKTVGVEVEGRRRRTAEEEERKRERELVVVERKLKNIGGCSFLFSVGRYDMIMMTLGFILDMLDS